jgi:hypothetical protein
MQAVTASPNRFFKSGLDVDDDKVIVRRPLKSQRDDLAYFRYCASFRTPPMTIRHLKEAESGGDQRIPMGKEPCLL